MICKFLPLEKSIFLRDYFRVSQFVPIAHQSFPVYRTILQLVLLMLQHEVSLRQLPRQDFDFVSKVSGLGEDFGQDLHFGHVVTVHPPK